MSGHSQHSEIQVRDQRSVLLVLVLAAGAVILFWRIAEGTAVAPDAASAWMLNSIVSVVGMAVGLRVTLNTYRLTGMLFGAGSLILSALNLAAVSIPAYTLVWGMREATVERLLGAQIATQPALTTALNTFSACIVAFLVGELLLARRAATASAARYQPSPVQKTMATILLLIGGLTYAADIAAGIGADFATRGEAQGGGLSSMAHWSLPLGICINVLNSHWKSKAYQLATVSGVSLIVLSGVRSPLMLICVAFVPRIIRGLTNRRHAGRIWVLSSAGTISLICVGSALNLWRGSIRRGDPIPLTEALQATYSDPLKALTQAGIDTLDGLLFVQYLPPGAVSTGPTDLLKAVTTLIPRQIYEDKPDFLSNIVSSRYLGFGTAGMFMSGPGYLELILGSTLAAVAGFLLLGLLYGRLFRLPADSIAWVVASYVLIRFYMGGDSFDIFAGLQLGLILTIAWLMATAIQPRRKT